VNSPDPRRREELLGLAEQLSKRLRSVEVRYLADPSAISIGVSASVMAHATSYLARVRDIAKFREFVSRLDQLDRTTAQNPDNPKAEHRVLRGELETFLADHAELSAEELLYVLAWARRLLPKASEQNLGRKGEPGPGDPGGMQVGRRGLATSPIKGGQLAAAFERAQREAGRRSASQDDPAAGKDSR
jgi:hypothetical protein